MRFPGSDGRMRGLPDRRAYRLLQAAAMMPNGAMLVARPFDPVPTEQG